MPSLRRRVEDLRRLAQTPWSQALDVEALLARRSRLREAGAGTPGATTTANVGGFAVPLGGRIVRSASGAGDIQGAVLLRPPGYIPAGPRRRKRRR